MTDMNFLRRLPLELYILILPSISIITTLYLSGNQMLNDPYIIHYGSTIITALACLAALSYGTKIVLRLISNLGAHRNGGADSLEIDKIVGGISSFLFIFGSIAVAVWAGSISILYLFNNSPTDKIITASESAMSLDLKIFGRYLPFALQDLGKIHALEMAVIFSYESLTFLLATFAIIMLFKKDIFRKFIFSYFIAVALAWPIWYLMPSLQPGLMFKTNLLKISLPASVELAVASHPSTEYTEHYIENINKFWIDPKGNKFSTSNNPSMHVAWGTMLTYFSIQSSPYLGLIAIPWFALNAVGTLYTLQHYGIDVVTGFLLACLTIFIAEKMVLLEKKYLDDRYKLLSMFDLIKKIRMHISEKILQTGQ